MNWDQIAGKWQRFQGKVQEKWGKLTDADMRTIAGKRSQLAGLLQQRYGYDQEQAEEEVREFSGALADATEQREDGFESSTEADDYKVREDDDDAAEQTPISRRARR